jgi:hypothetical protein
MSKNFEARKKSLLAAASWWSGGISNRMPLVDAFVGLRHFSIERDYVLREIPPPAYRSVL